MMTLKDVARKLRSHADFVGSLGGSGELMDSVDLGGLADAIDVLSQPQPVAQGEAVAWVLYHGDDVAGLTNDRSEMEEWERDGLTFAALYKATPTIPTGHRVVPDDAIKAAAVDCARSAYGYWKGDSTGGDSAMTYFDRNRGLGGISYTIELMESAIRKALLAASPSAGGV